MTQQRTDPDTGPVDDPGSPGHDLAVQALPRPGRFGDFGGRYVPEALIPALEQLDEARQKAAVDPEFQDQLARLHATYTGRPSIVTEVPRFGAHCGGARVLLKREDLNHTGSHKINNVLAQCLLTQRMGKTRVIAETGAGQHGVATATVCARFGMDCTVYMGAVDMERQALNVTRMRLMGAKVVPVTAGQATLKEAVNESMRDWVATVDDTHYILGSALGPHPFPMMVRDFHRVIGVEAREQVLRKEGRLPDLLVACVGGGSNAMGLFHPFVDDTDVRLVGVEAGGDGIIPERHAARFQGGKLGVLQGSKTWLLANDDGQIELTHSVSAGLDYAAVGPEHAYLQDIGRAEYTYATDDEALAAFRELAYTEGIIPALESAHAMAYVSKVAGSMSKDDIIIANLSGRGDKDVEQASKYLLV